MRLPLATPLLLVTGLAALGMGQETGQGAEQGAEQGAGQGAGQAHNVSTIEGTPRNTGGNQVGLRINAQYFDMTDFPP